MQLVLRKILGLRNVARPFIKHYVGNGSSIFLWSDNWHLDGPLHLKYGSRPIYDAASTFNAKLETMVYNGWWHWPPARSEALVAIPKAGPAPLQSLLSSFSPVYGD